MKKTALIWFRNDLRLHDNDAVQWAIKEHYQILPFFYHSDCDHEWALGGASRWWLHHALTDFEAQITKLGGALILGDPTQPVELALREAITTYQVEALLWNRLYEPRYIKRDTSLKSYFKEQGLHVQSFNSAILSEPTKVSNKSGGPFKVFTPFWKSLASQEVASIKNELTEIQWKTTKGSGAGIKDLALLPKLRWDTGFYGAWEPTRAGAIERLTQFYPHKAALYSTKRDRPDLDFTTKLSPYLHFGQLGPRELVHSLRKEENATIETGIVRQVYWREFAHHLLYHFPQTPTQPLYQKYAVFPWEENPEFVQAWQRGETGFPIVDAGMRQLWATGWMHNRVRMIVGSFLVKHLLQPWQEGAAWFWDTLVDASLANNTLGWQWIAGCGADGAPYFRVFNPITQGQKFDTTGDYVRKWCPELKNVPLKYLHCPFDAPPLELQAAGVTLGKNYPHPVISHADGRAKALRAFEKFKLIQQT